MPTHARHSSSAPPVIGLWILILAFGTLSTLALRVQHDRGTWPENWPKEMEVLRARAHSIEWATGTQEDTHQIRFKDRQDFVTVWPILEKLLTPGSQLRLRKPVPETSETNTGHDLAAPSVIIHAPPAAVAFDGKRSFRMGYTWPKSVYLPNGQLPAYVVDRGAKNGERDWRPLPENEVGRGFRYRARIDFTLICDDKIIDFEKLDLPKTIRVVDERDRVPARRQSATPAPPASLKKGK